MPKCCVGKNKSEDEPVVQTGTTERMTEMTAVPMTDRKEASQRLMEREESEFSFEPRQRSSITRSLIDLNLYSTKKNIAQGMLGLSLLSANCSQLKYLLHYSGADLSGHYFLINLACIGASITLQVIVGIMLIINIRHNINFTTHHSSADSYCNTILIGVFIITIINIFLSIFISAK